MWITVMIFFWILATATWILAAGFVRKCGYAGNYAMKTGITQRNQTLTSLNVIRREGRPKERRKARMYLFIVVGSWFALFDSFLLTIRNL